jgi:prepilin-type N-terminal cleavage/methylation domain-containing protein
MQKDMRLRGHKSAGRWIGRSDAAFTLVEVVISMMVVGIMLAGLVSLYTQSAVRAEWSAYSLAGQMMALRGLEQTRAAKWDPRATPGVDELVATNFPQVVDILDLGPSGSGTTYATNVTTIQTVSASPPLKVIRVQCTWSFPWRGGLFTNSIFTYRGPDQ